VIPSPGTVLRLALLSLAAVVLQISGVVSLRLLGGNADVLPLLVASVGLLAGSISGAVAGFIVGLLVDLALGLNLGGSSLVLIGVGYGVGRFRELRDPSNTLTPIPVGAAATAGYVVGIAAVSFMLSVEAPVSILLLRDMVITIILNALLALPVFAIVRRALRPVLVADPFERRRRERPAGAAPIGLRGLEAR
jgi:rod shape-determining protein MreD